MGKDGKRRGRAGWWIASGVVVAAAAAYGGTAAATAGSIPDGTTVHGVDIGGLAPEAAADRLERRLGPVADEPVAVEAGGRKAALDPDTAGLALDVEATLAGTTGFTLDPVVLWERLTGGRTLEPELRVDRQRLRAALEAASEEVLNARPTEGSIGFEGTEIVVEKPRPGVEVDVPGAVEAVAGAWFDAAGPLQLPAERPKPKVPAEAYETARQELARPLVNGPVTVKAGNLSGRLDPAELAAAASFQVADGKIGLELDSERLAEDLLEANPELGSSARDAEIVLRDGRPAIIPSRVGRGIDTSNLGPKITAALDAGKRTVSVDLRQTQPDLTTQEAEDLGVDEVVADFSTPYPTSNEIRTKNLRAGSQKLNGVLVMPGETFSLLEHLAPITKANGYFESGVVEEGFESTAVGGGLSQISTQLFNAGFLAGMDDVEHQPHSRWFERYPAGREATLWEGSIDMKWRNNTDYAVLVQAWVGPDRVHTRLWGTDVWDVRTSTSEHFNITEPKTVYNDNEDCTPEPGGKNGFTVEVTRTRSSATQTLPKETLRWTYQPWNKVVCEPQP